MSNCVELCHTVFGIPNPFFEDHAKMESHKNLHENKAWRYKRWWEIIKR